MMRNKSGRVERYGEEMLQGSYGKEPFDLRLTVLRLMMQIHIILGVTLLGMLLFGGGYYVKNVLLRTEQLYEVTSVYHVEYAVESEVQIGTVYINQTSWNTYMQSEDFLNAVQAHLKQDGASAGTLQMDNEALGACIEAHLASDLRMPSTTVTTENAADALVLARAVEATMEQEMPVLLREINAIHTVDSPVTASEVVPDVRVGRALVLSGVLSLFFAVIALLLKETWADAIWLPATIYKRYDIKAVGTVESRELVENLKYFFVGMERVVLCPVEEAVNPAEVLETLKETVSERAVGGASIAPKMIGESWFAVPSPLLCPEVCESMRQADGVLLAVSAGSHVGRRLEKTLEFLAQQDCKVTAAVLVGADERLLGLYYLGKKF